MPLPDRPHRRFLGLALLTCLLALAACSERVQDTHPQQWVSQRQALFKEFTRTLEPMGLAARDRRPYNPSEFMASAIALQALAQRPWSLFPADSQYPPTRAKAAVWGEPAAFVQAQQAYVASVDALVQAAQAGTLDAVRPAVDDVQQACKACHDRFRSERPAR